MRQCRECLQRDASTGRLEFYDLEADIRDGRAGGARRQAGGSARGSEAVIPLSLLALVGCGNDRRDATVSDETRSAGLQAALAAATHDCGNRGSPRDYGCGRRLEQRTQEVLDGLDGLDDPTKREHIDHALNTVASECDACETRLRHARP